VTATRPRDARRSQLGEAVRDACIAAAVAAHEDAALSGLCPEGAFEAAVGAMRGIDVAALLDEIERAATG
jgi:hypothetical protein